MENKKIELKIQNYAFQGDELENLLLEARKIELEKLSYFYIGGSVP